MGEILSPLEEHPQSRALPAPQMSSSKERLSHPLKNSPAPASMRDQYPQRQRSFHCPHPPTHPPCPLLPLEWRISQHAGNSLVVTIFKAGHQGWKYHTLNVCLFPRLVAHLWDQLGTKNQQPYTSWFPVMCVLVVSVIWVMMASEELQTGHNRKAGKELALYKRFSQLGKKHKEKFSSVRRVKYASHLWWISCSIHVVLSLFLCQQRRILRTSMRTETLVGTSNLQQLLHLTRHFL